MRYLRNARLHTESQRYKQKTRDGSEEAIARFASAQMNGELSET